MGMAQRSSSQWQLLHISSLIAAQGDTTGLSLNPLTSKALRASSGLQKSKKEALHKTQVCSLNKYFRTNMMNISINEERNQRIYNNEEAG